MQHITSPQAPPDLQPVPFEEKPVSILGLNTAQVRAFVELNVRNLGQLELWLAEGNTFISVDGIGAKGAEKAAGLLEALR